MSGVLEVFVPHDWYWIVGGDESRLWSSRVGGYVLPGDEAYAAWRAQGGTPTRIADEFELDLVLRQHGRSVGGVFAPEEALAALMRIDAQTVKAALGRDTVLALESGDAEKLQTILVMPGVDALQIVGVERPRTVREELADLKAAYAEIATRLARLEGAAADDPAIG